MKILRVHGTEGTADIPVVGKSPKAPQTEAYYIMREGYWIENKLYPPSTITYVEILTV